MKKITLSDKKDNTILLKNERVVIEVKKTRLGLADKELGGQIETVKMNTMKLEN